MRSLHALFVSALMFATACDGCGDNELCVQFGPECGKSCVDTFSCAEGLYCSSDNTCAVDCNSDEQCGDGKLCTTHGQCIDGSGASNTGGTTGEFMQNGGAGGGTAQGGNCPGVEVVFEPTTPTVLLLVD